jgi:hypothetical protein
VDHERIASSERYLILAANSLQRDPRDVTVQVVERHQAAMTTADESPGAEASSAWGS